MAVPTNQESGFFGAFTASDEIALLRGYALDGSGEINDVRLVFNTDEGVVDMQWDGNSKAQADQQFTLVGGKLSSGSM